MSSRLSGVLAVLITWTTNGKLVAQYYHAGDLDRSTGADNDTGARFYTLGYEHSLSKRTLLKAHYAYLKNDDKTSTNGFGGRI
jgi:predicted porin